MLLPPVPFQMKSMPNYNRTYNTHMYISRSHTAGRNACVKCYKGNAGNGGGCAAVARLSGSAAVTAAASLFVHFRTSHRDCRILPAAAPINSEHSCSVKRGHVCMEVWISVQMEIFLSALNAKVTMTGTHFVLVTEGGNSGFLKRCCVCWMRLRLFTF